MHDFYGGFKLEITTLLAGQLPLQLHLCKYSTRSHLRQVFAKHDYLCGFLRPKMTLFSTAMAIMPPGETRETSRLGSPELRASQSTLLCPPQSETSPREQLTLLIALQSCLQECRLFLTGAIR